MPETKTVHEPEVIVSESCQLKCGRLGSVLGEAALGAIIDPDAQYAVACEGKKGLSCKAILLRMGLYDERDDLRPNPVYIGENSGRTAHSIVDDLIDAGAQLTPLSQFEL